MLAVLMTAALLAQAPATTEAEAGSEAPKAAAAASTAPAKPAKPKKVCVEEAPMGSHFRKRICATPEEWERRRLKDEAAMARARAETPTR